MLHYHPTTELLMDYAAGSLPLAHAISVATHLEHCQECRNTVAKLNQIGSSLFAEQETHLAEPTNFHSLKAHLLDNLDQLSIGQESEEQQPATQNANYRIPKSLRQFVQEDYDSLEWTRLSSSLKVATLCTDGKGSQVALTRIKAGSHIPTHSHTGEEITLVLEGSFSDESGIYGKGDFISRNQTHKHKPIVSKDSECICLTVLDAPIQFTGFFTRWLNPLLRRHHPNGV